MNCSAPGCERAAAVRVILYDVYLYNTEAEVFYEEDYTCPYLCAEHVTENETKAVGVREPRGFVKYPYTNRGSAQGFTIYLPLDQDQQKTLLRLLLEQSANPATRN